jgi:hypothetical protein
MKKEDIKKEILRIAGNPESGPIAEFADTWAESLEKLANPIAEIKRFEPVKETRVQEIKETR